MPKNAGVIGTAIGLIAVIVPFLIFYLDDGHHQINHITYSATLQDKITQSPLENIVVSFVEYPEISHQITDIAGKFVFEIDKWKGTEFTLVRFEHPDYKTLELVQKIHENTDSVPIEMTLKTLDSSQIIIDSSNNVDTLSVDSLQ